MPKRQVWSRWKNWSAVSCFRSSWIFSPKSDTKVARFRRLPCLLSNSSFVDRKNHALTMCSEYAANSCLGQICFSIQCHLQQGWNRVLVSLISWPGQLLSLNPCRRPKILARMLILGILSLPVVILDITAYLIKDCDYW